ncbi:MAG: alpha/beta hydrolase [Candidatus Parcubacteria bacterium]|nr:alpha/beta hydrolase [Burkholderiales bacterium]
MRRIFYLFLAFLGLAFSARACLAENFTTSDGVRLHYIAEGRGETLVFVPGWSMPAEIWRYQIAHFSRKYRVVALDPRSQGDSQVATSGNAMQRRAEDLNDLIEHLQARRVVLVGWSLGVLESLMFINMHGDSKVAALVFVDNSVGESPGQGRGDEIRYEPPRDRQREMATFVGSMFKTRRPPEYLEWLTHEAMRTPPEVGARLLKIPYPRAYWRSAVHNTRKPLLYAVTPSLKEQAETLMRRRKGETSIEIFPGAGHALFVDDQERFNASLEAFLGRIFQGAVQ